MQTHFLLIFVLTTIAVAAIAAAGRSFPPPSSWSWWASCRPATPGPPQVEIAPELVLLLALPPLVYWAGVTMELARVPLRHPLHQPTRGRWRDLHDSGRCRRRSLSSWLGLGGRLCAGRHRLAARRGCPDGDRSSAGTAATHHGDPRRRRRHDATAPILKFAVVAVATGTFSFGSAFLVFSGHRRGRDRCLRVGGGVCQPAASQMGRADPRIEILLLLDAVAFWVPAYLGGSGCSRPAFAGSTRTVNGPLLIRSQPACRGSFSGTC